MHVLQGFISLGRKWNLVLPVYSFSCSTAWFKTGIESLQQKYLWTLNAVLYLWEFSFWLGFFFKKKLSLNWDQVHKSHKPHCTLSVVISKQTNPGWVSAMSVPSPLVQSTAESTKGESARKWIKDHYDATDRQGFCLAFMHYISLNDS